jgi:very-short-patch-repair endonuclease
VSKQFARQLRRNATDVEKRLWYFLQNRQLDGYKFRRQHGIADYIVDFVCLERKLIVELDGGQHAGRADRDEERTHVLESMGFQVVRFWNNEVLSNTVAVLEVIREALRTCPSPQPSPQAGERE